jgi:hypothetical protein
MTHRGVSPEMEAKLAVVREANSRLEEKHVKWIIDAAIAHFADAVEKLEVTIARYDCLPELPMYSRYGRQRGSYSEPANRQAEIPKLRASLNDYYAILTFLDALGDAEIVRNAEVFAQELSDSGFSGRGATRPTRRGSGR